MSHARVLIGDDKPTNLKLAAHNGGNGNTSAPVIVWLSYNVHGNETSSSEAAMMTLYALVDPANSRTKSGLWASDHGGVVTKLKLK